MVFIYQYAIQLIQFGLAMLKKFTLAMLKKFTFFGEEEDIRKRAYFGFLFLYSFLYSLNSFSNHFNILVSCRHIWYWRCIGCKQIWSAPATDQRSNWFFMVEQSFPNSLYPSLHLRFFGFSRPRPKQFTIEAFAVFWFAFVCICNVWLFWCICHWDQCMYGVGNAGVYMRF